MALDQELEDELKRLRVDVKDLVKSLRSEFSLVVYGETHVGLETKSDFFARLIRDHGDRFYASEHFDNDVSIGAIVEDFLKGKKTKSALPSDLRPMATVLEAIKDKLPNAGLVFAGSKDKSRSGRDKKLFENFKLSRGLHLKAKRFTDKDPGHFHIGSAHGARLPFGGSTPTTTQLLIKDGLNPGSVRIVTKVVGDTSDVTGGGTSFTAGESMIVQPVAGGDMMDLAAIVVRASGGNPFGADIRGSSVFAKVRPDESTRLDGYNKFFDTILFVN